VIAMPRTPENLVRHELIGLPVTVAESTDATKEGLEGRVVDETRQTLTIQTESDTVQLPKDESVFHFALDSGDVVEVDGSVLVARPEERILKKFPRKWEYTDNE
jgi:ribonuclease P protein subunit POP4